MAPGTPSSDESHQRLLDSLDISHARRPFRNPSWKPAQRRNKNVKQILTEASRKEASLVVSSTAQSNSGMSTPVPVPTMNAPSAAAAVAGNPPQAGIAQAAQNLSTLVLERNLQKTTAATAAAAGTAASSGPVATYTNIESAPSLLPSHQKRYCDITGLPAPYTDPKTRLRYHNMEIFGVIRNLGPGMAEKYLEARGANVVLK